MSYDRIIRQADLKKMLQTWLPCRLKIHTYIFPFFLWQMIKNYCIRGLPSCEMYHSSFGSERAQPLKTKRTWEICIFVGNVHVPNTKVASDPAAPANNYSTEKKKHKREGKKIPSKNDDTKASLALCLVLFFESRFVETSPKPMKSLFCFLFKISFRFGVFPTQFSGHFWVKSRYLS